MKTTATTSPATQPRRRITIAAKMTLGFMLIIVMISALFIVAGVKTISDRIAEEGQEKVRNDLNAAREIYSNRLVHANDIVRLTASRAVVREALISGNYNLAVDELVAIKDEEGLDVLTVTDKYGYVVIRASNPAERGDNQGRDELVNTVLLRKEPMAGTVIVPSHDLQNENPLLAEQAVIQFIDTPLARERAETEQTHGMMLKAAAPVFDGSGELIGVVYGGELLNRNYEIVDKIKQTVYEDVIYKGEDIGTATIFQDDVRISTNVIDRDGSRAIGTRVSEEVYDQVVMKGERWFDRAYVVNNWYITAYEPIRNSRNTIVGILYVGVLEQKYSDIRQETIQTFVAISIIGTLATMVVAYLLATRISDPINDLVKASKQVAEGNLDARVELSVNDELQSLAESFNAMAEALQRRDEQIKDFTTKRIMESERLALVGQLSANIAHELNNPLQGIVTFSHLLLEEHKCDDPEHIYSLEKIVGQANRCRDIIRGLLDFARQRKPDKAFSNVNEVLHECVALVEHQALFQNIQVIKHFQEDMPFAVIDAAQIERVFINMIVNAAEAMEGRGYLNISTRHNARNDAIEIAFSDSGPGISPENIKKIFDPFFTTKDVGHGTGLGLAISYGIVKGHNGSISVDSKVGHGTTFIVQLPVKADDEVEEVSTDED